MIGPAQNIAQLLPSHLHGSIDYVLSSHNIEHIPNPIKFLQGCSQILATDGYLSLAIPDHRCCFDYFLPVTTVADWLEAYIEHRDQPTPKQVFLRGMVRAEATINGKPASSFPLFTPAQDIHVMDTTLSDALNLWKITVASRQSSYIDAHCWFFTPASFQLIMLELQELALCDLYVSNHGCPVK
jgi:SAM-dependent methyltransferase